MGALAKGRPGVRGVDWMGNGAGGEITISYWADDASAAAWPDHPKHGKVQLVGRGRWLERYDPMVADIRRGHVWERGRQGSVSTP